MTTIRTRCDVCRLDSNQPPSEVALYESHQAGRSMILFQCLECGEFNRQSIPTDPTGAILISAGVIQLPILDVADLILDDDMGLHREIDLWAAEISG